VNGYNHCSELVLCSHAYEPPNQFGETVINPILPIQDCRRLFKRKS